MSSVSRDGCYASTLLLTMFLASLSMTVHTRREACSVCDCDRDLPVVDCTNRGLQELPTGIPIDTEILELGENSLKEIPYNGLSRFSNLTKLNITGNSIRKPFEIPESLESLFAGRNKLQDIKPIMENGINLQNVNFSYNEIMIIESNTFARCTEISDLYLDYNKISEIEEKGLAGPKDIMNLELDNNRLTELGPANTEGLHCGYLWLRNTGLRVLKSYTFGRISNLGIIHLHYNMLEELPHGLFLDPTRARHSIELIITRFIGNRIRSISPSAFRGVQTIHFLSFSKNLLQSVPEDLFVNLTIKGILDISSNRLTSIPDGLFRHQTELKNIYLQRNQIRVLNDKIFKGLRSLKEVMIFDNPVTEVADWLFYETRLTNLYMFQTNLTSLGSRPFATKDKTIKQLSLYGNRLESISDDVWQDLSSNCYVAIDNILKFAPASNRTDLKIELVGDGFAQPIRVTLDVAKLFNQSGFSCHLSELQGRGNWQCTPCPQGFYGAPETNGCKACPPGGFYQIKTGQVADEAQGINCQFCNNGTYVTPEAHPGKNPADCTVCPTGTDKSRHAGFRACPCLDNYYRKDRFGECYPCPTQGLNCSAEYLHLLPGFWWTWDWGSDDNYRSYKQFVQNILMENTSYNKNTQQFLGTLPKVHLCPRKESCVNAEDGLNATCEDGYKGWLCSQCSRNFYSWFDRCFKCPKWWWFLLEVVLVFLVILVLILVIARDLHRHRRGGGRSVVNVLLARGKILLGFYQVMGEIFSALHEIPWPEILTSVGSFLKLLEVNIVQLIISPRCYFPEFIYPIIYIEFLISFSFVVCVVFVAWSFCCLTKCYLTVRKAPVAKRDAVLSQINQKCYLIVVVLLFVSYPGISSVTLTLLPSGCDLFYLDEHENLSVSRLRSDYSINCETEQHVHFNHAAEAALSYVVGFPCLLFLLLWWRNKRQQGNGIPRDGCGSRTDIRRESAERPLMNFSGYLGSDQGVINDLGMLSTDGENTGPNQQDNEPLLDLMQSRQDKLTWESFLCENYKPKFWYWEIVELARKIIQTLLVLLFGSEDHFTMFATIVISVGFLVVHAYLRPMKDAAEHRLQMCSLATIFLNLLAASLLLLPSDQDHSSEERKEVLAVVLVLLNLSIIVFVTVSLVWTCLRALWRRRCIGCMVTCIAGLYGKCCQQRESEHVGQDPPESIDVEYTERPYAEIIAEHHSGPGNT